jgi:hypothetical protein
MQKMQSDDNIRLSYDSVNRCIVIAYKDEKPEKAPLENVVQFTDLQEDVNTQVFKAAKQK